MDILLINPLNENTIQSEVPSFLSEERGLNPPLGLLYVASSLIAENHSVRVLDMPCEGISYADIPKYLEGNRPDIVGITVMSFTLIDVLIVSEIIKKFDDSITVVYGGPHVNIFPEESIRLPHVDYLVLGEGELSFPKLVACLENEMLPLDVSGVVFQKDNKIVNTGNPEFITDLDSIPFPARDLTPFEKYSSLLAKRSPITTMISSRGCPHRCLFCDRPHLGKSFRARSPVNIVDEFTECVELGIREFIIYDDTFTIDRDRVLEVCKEIRDRGLDIGWDVRARVSDVDTELLSKMRSAGCERIHFGVESGNEKILKVIRKGITKGQALDAFNWAKDSGISTLAYFMIGHPGETMDTVQETIDFAIKLDPDFIHFSITTPFPSTDLYRMGLEDGIIERDYWSEYAHDPSPDFIPPLWEENMNRVELTNLLKQAYKSFYIRPNYIIKELSRVSSMSELYRKMRAGVKLIGRVI